MTRWKKYSVVVVEVWDWDMVLDIDDSVTIYELLDKSTR